VEPAFLIGALAIGFVLVAVLLVIVLLRLGSLSRTAVDGAELVTRLTALGAQNERLERELRSEPGATDDIRRAARHDRVHDKADPPFTLVHWKLA